MGRAKITKEVRQTIFRKYGGRCAYCGCELKKGWHVDHIKPRIFGGTNELDNLNPSCKDCNTYKCHTDLEGYRKQLYKMLNEKLEYLFRSKTKMQVAMNMGSIKHALWDGKFYFEKICLEKESSKGQVRDSHRIYNKIGAWQPTVDKTTTPPKGGVV